jgi:hypothetical protein
MVLGRSPYGGPYRVWRRLIGRPLPDTGRSYTDQGRRWEPVIRAAYLVETGREIRTFRPWTMYQRENWSTSTPDGAIRDGDEWGLAELKLAFDFATEWPPSRTIERWTRGALPRRDWYLQAVHQCWVLDAPWCELVVMPPGSHELRVYRIMRDLELEGRLIPQLCDWYMRHVIERKPVAPSADDELLVAAERHAPEDGRRYRPRPATALEREQVKALHAWRYQEKGCHWMAARFTAAIYESAGRASALTFTEDGVTWRASIVRSPPSVRVTQSNQRRSRVDLRRALAEGP